MFLWIVFFPPYSTQKSNGTRYNLFSNITCSRYQLGSVKFCNCEPILMKLVNFPCLVNYLSEFSIMRAQASMIENVGLRIQKAKTSKHQ